MTTLPVSSVHFESQPGMERRRSIAIPSIDAPFGSRSGTERRRSISISSAADTWSGFALASLYVGAAAEQLEDGSIQIGIAIHDGTYSIDFCVQKLEPLPKESAAEAIRRTTRSHVDRFCDEHCGKFVGAGIAASVAGLCPNISEFLWSELDIVCMVFDVRTTVKAEVVQPDGEEGEELLRVGVDEQADSAVRKLITNYGPQNQPLLAIGFRNKVEESLAGRMWLVNDRERYRETVSEQTWKCTLHYAEALRKRKVKVAFFSATPQGGGVALMRHALIRFFRLMGVSAEWYIPKPNPSVFRITKTNHNILQGVAAPGVRFDADKQRRFSDWITYNARQYWLSAGGPLAAGGANVVIIDDPQMPGLIPLIREARPDVKIIYRSHIEIRSDLVHVPDSPQAEVWDYLWNRISAADVFISHPVAAFVPSSVPAEKVGLMPASTDWLDGLNKPMREWDMRYYHHLFRNDCHNIGMPQLAYPGRDYITQIARFDPSKGLPTVLEAYRLLRERFHTSPSPPLHPPPQLLVCGHGAIDDPDGSIIYDQTIALLDSTEYDEIREDIVVMRIGPSDQLLNALISAAKIVWQLSSREGFEVKVSEALHKGKPVVATRAGGIPLQVRDGETGFLVDVGDAAAVAERSWRLLGDEELYKDMSEKAKKGVSDEVGTVGNAVAWMYLADVLSRGVDLKPNAEWVADLARKEVGVEWGPEEPRLPRGVEVIGECTK